MRLNKFVENATNENFEAFVNHDAFKRIAKKKIFGFLYNTASLSLNPNIWANWLKNSGAKDVREPILSSSSSKVKKLVQKAMSSTNW